jgi:pyruvate dehydrogenase E2 component (dihydrolipoamide acetyltransferase)
MMRLEVTIGDPAGFEEVEVIDVLVAAGDAVAEGDVLLVLATDKANLDIAAPAAGTVAEVLVSRDAIIASDAVLIVLET